MSQIMLNAILIITFIQLIHSFYIPIARSYSSPLTMSYYRIRPYRGPNDMAQEFPSTGILPTYRSIINEFFNDGTDSSTLSNIPIDIKEKKDSYVVIADVPGVNKEDIKISLKENILSISTERKSEEIEEGEQFKREERFVGVIKRSITLPDQADYNKIEAKYENGVLRLHIPKLPNDPKQIERIIQIA